MTHLYFHCSSADRVVIDPCGTDVDDLSDARARAVGFVRRLVSSKGPDDWRSWTLHVADENGEELFLMPFTYVLGKPH